MSTGNSKNSQPVTAKEVSVRAFQEEDILPLVEYWTGNSEEFWRQRGVDPAKLSSRETFITGYQKAFKEKGGVSTVVTILLQGKAVGVHTLTDLIPKESAVFHAHIWKEENRHRGVGIYSYLKGSEFFLKNLSLKKILFKTPKLNMAAHRIKEKIGIPPLGDTLFDAPILLSPLPATLYELSLEQIQILKKKHKMDVL
jgi:hypothetical protein